MTAESYSDAATYINMFFFLFHQIRLCFHAPGDCSVWYFVFGQEVLADSWVCVSGSQPRVGAGAWLFLTDVRHVTVQLEFHYWQQMIESLCCAGFQAFSGGRLSWPVTAVQVLCFLKQMSVSFRQTLLLLCLQLLLLLLLWYSSSWCCRAASPTKKTNQYQAVYLWKTKQFLFNKSYLEALHSLKEFLLYCLIVWMFINPSKCWDDPIFFCSFFGTLCVLHNNQLLQEILAIMYTFWDMFMIFFLIENK